MKKIIPVFLLIKSIILLYGSYIGISTEEYFEILNLQLNSKLYYIGFVAGIIFLICSFGVYKYNKHLIKMTKFVVVVDILYLAFTTLYTAYSFLFLSYITLDFSLVIFFIAMILGYIDFYILKQIKDIN